MSDTEPIVGQGETTSIPRKPLIRRSNLRLFALGTFYLVFLVIGAAIFAAIEGPGESSLVTHAKAFRVKFYNAHKHCISGAGIFMSMEGPNETILVQTLKEQRRLFAENNGCILDEDLEKFIHEVVYAANRGVSAVHNVTQNEPNWSFGQALFFATTVVTTIGYGRVTPLSDAGKAFCICFAVVGIPLTLVLFTACVERLMVPTRHLLYWLYGKLGHIYKVFHIQMLHLSIILFLHVVFFMLIPAAIFDFLEPEWNYLDAFYYCFISLSTIGLGDYIPGDSEEQPHRAMYKVATTLYLLMGITVLLLLVTVYYDIPELNLGYYFYLKSDEFRPRVEDDEQTRLKPTESGNSNKYTKQVDDIQSIKSDHYQSYQQDVITPVPEEEP